MVSHFLKEFAEQRSTGRITERYFVNQTTLQQKTDRVAGTIMTASRALQLLEKE